MADDSVGNVATEAAKGLAAIFQRIADFFDIFDLSFIVAGATTVAALAFLAWRTGTSIAVLPEGWIRTVALIVSSYVLGLVCFATGRFIDNSAAQVRKEDKFRTAFLSVLKGHGIDDQEPFSSYLERTDARGEWRLYVRLWAEIRRKPALAASLSLLRRYWVMAATYDGLVVAFAVWVLVLIICSLPVVKSPIPPQFSVPGVLALIFAATACSEEARRYFAFQIEELVASIASLRE